MLDLNKYNLDSTAVCRICSNVEGNVSVEVREMMLGLREEFPYFQCGKCGCLQIRCIPSNLDKYYPPTYYGPAEAAPSGILKKYLLRLRSDYILNGRSALGGYLYKRLGSPRAKIFGSPEYSPWIRGLTNGLSSRILEVGCGNGDFLLQLRSDGFRDLTGVDPFRSNNVVESGFRLLRTELFDIEGQFDLIMLHHTFEHMPEPDRVFSFLRAALNPGGWVILRIPVANSFAHRKYGKNWAQIDAPRHLFLHTVDSIKMLSNRVGLRLDCIEFDSTDFQFWASEQYLRDIPLHDPRSYAMQQSGSLFTENEIEEFKEQAKKLNIINDGDMACFRLSHTRC